MKTFFSAVGMSFSTHQTGSRSWSTHWAFSALSNAGWTASYINDGTCNETGASKSFGFSA